MKTLMIIAAALFCFTMVTAAHADTAGDAVAHVFLKINPNIGVQAVTANVDAGTLQSGCVAVPITFQIDANTEAVALSALVTQLYKGDDPTLSPTDPKYVPPIPIDLGKGLEIDPEHANPFAGASCIATYLTPDTFSNSKGEFAGMLSQVVNFESSQAGDFSQKVHVTPTWINTDRQQVQGEYSGYVVLYASVIDSQI